MEKDQPINGVSTNDTMKTDHKAQISKTLEGSKIVNNSYIEMKFNGVTEYALVDTGCTGCIISEVTVAKHGLKARLNPRLKVFVEAIEGDVETCGAIMNCEFEFNGCSILWPVNVLNLGPNVIIGADMLSAMKAKISCSKNILMLQIKESGTYVRLPLVDIDVIEEQELQKKEMETKKSIYHNQSKKSRINRKNQKSAEEKMKADSNLFDVHKNEPTPHFFAEIEINGVCLTALIDTGATCSILPQEDVTYCEIDCLIDPVVTYSIRKGEGKKITTRVIQECEFKLDEYAFSARFMVSINAIEAFIGQNILRKLGATIDYEKKELRFHMNNRLIRYPLETEYKFPLFGGE